MPHEKFDLPHWERVFAGHPDCARWNLPGRHVNVAARVCHMEQERARLRADYDLGPAVPCDIFVFALGEPADRSVTKYGGLPYRSAITPWPREDIVESTILLEDDLALVRRLTHDDWAALRNDGSTVGDFIAEAFPPLQFLAQFNFGDSRDLVGELPGDVLLLFGSYGHPYIRYYEWQPLGLETLVDAGQIPPCPFAEDEFRVCYGQIHRTCDYPEAEARHPALAERHRDHALFRLEAHRIGGVPFVLQDELRPGRLIAVMNGVCPDLQLSWPWTNVERVTSDPVPGRRASRKGERPSPAHRTFIESDVSIYLSIDDQGGLHWEDQCS